MWDNLLNFLSDAALYIGYVLLAIFLIVGMVESIKFVIKGIKSSDANLSAEKNLHQNQQIIDKKTIAAITAAITCYYNEQAKHTGTPVTGFVVRSIKKRI